MKTEIERCKQCDNPDIDKSDGDNWCDECGEYVETYFDWDYVEQISE